MQTKPKDPWSTRTLEKNILLSLAISFISFVSSLSFYSSFKYRGYVTFHHHPGFRGEEALLIIFCALAIGCIFSIISIYLIIKQYLLLKKDKLPKDVSLAPEFVICTECEEPFIGFERLSMICKRCGGKLVDLKGYYPDSNLADKLKRKAKAIEKIQQY